MAAEHVHRVKSADGTEIVARVQGDGPPLVFLPAGPGTSEASWRHVVPHLSDRFTCYMVDTRGRGLSTNSPDHSTARIVEDVLALLDDVGEPAALVEWGTVLWALVAAEQPAGAIAAEVARFLAAASRPA